jgi:hypothetical protein
MTRFTSVLALGIVFGMMAVASQAAITYSDDFSAAHDYVANGTSGTMWDGIVNAGSLALADTTTNAGALNMTLQGNAAYGWDLSHLNAPLLYKEVSASQDFSVQVKINDATAASNAWNVAGILAYKDDTAFVGANANFFGAPYFQSRSVGGGVQHDSLSPTESIFGSTRPLYLKLNYKAATSTFNYSASTDGSTWTAITWGGIDFSGTTETPMGTDLVRSDMTGTLKVGLAFSDYNGVAGNAAQFGNFSLTVGTVPEPSSMALILSGLIGLAAYAWRRYK